MQLISLIFIFSTIFFAMMLKQIIMMKKLGIDPKLIFGEDIYLLMNGTGVVAIITFALFYQSLLHP